MFILRYLLLFTPKHFCCLHSDTFVEDFFLTYPSFMTMSDLCEGLLERYKGRELEEEGTDQPNAVGRKGEGRRGADTTSERLRKQT